MADKTIFHVRHVAEDEPVNTDPFWSWLQANNKAPGLYLEAVREYLEGLGCDVHGQHIAPEAGRVLRAVYEIYCAKWTPIREPRPLADLLTEVPPGTPGAYWLRNTGRTVRPAPDVIAVLVGAGLAGGHGPENIIFELRGDLLRVVYSHILGHRNICRVTDQGGDNE